MKTKNREEKIAAIVAEMTAITEFALGSVKPNRKRHTVKDGSVRETKTQYLFQSRGGRGKQTGMHWRHHNAARIAALIAKYRSAA